MDSAGERTVPTRQRGASAEPAVPAPLAQAPSPQPVPDAPLLCKPPTVGLFCGPRNLGCSLASPNVLLSQGRVQDQTCFPCHSAHRAPLPFQNGCVSARAARPGNSPSFYLSSRRKNHGFSCCLIVIVPPEPS